MTQQTIDLTTNEFEYSLSQNSGYSELVDGQENIISLSNVGNIIGHSEVIQLYIRLKEGLTVPDQDSERTLNGTITFSYKEIDQLNKIIEILKLNY